MLCSLKFIANQELDLHLRQIASQNECLESFKQHVALGATGNMTSVSACDVC